MNVFAEIKNLVLASLTTMQNAGELPKSLDFSAITVEPTRDKSHGDMATNAALVLGKATQKNPRELAEKLKARLEKDKRITEVDIAGPGFLNIHFKVEMWHEFLVTILRDRKKFGRSQLGKGKKVNVEYVSANPTGPLHVGHARGAVFGDALANLLDFAGYQVTREYYVNDGGAQVDVLAGSAHQRYLEANGATVNFSEGTYSGDYLIEVGEALKKEYGTSLMDVPESEWRPIVRDFAINEMMKLIEADLATLGVKMNKFFSEESLYDTGQIEGAIEALREKGLIYQGTLPPPKGKQLEDWEAREQTLFKSTEYGDDVDRPIQKSDGSWTYFAPDIAYHYNKVQRDYDRLVNVFGADHGGYVKRIKAAVSALSDKEIDFDVKTVKLVKLLKNGEPYKMSKRSGNFVSLRDLLEQVPVGVVRFTMLTRKNDAELDFDFDKVLEASKENPVFYVQYANARVKSVFRRISKVMTFKLKFENSPLNDSRGNFSRLMMTGNKSIHQVEGMLDMVFADLERKELSVLTHERELELIKKMAEWPRLVESAAIHNEPHRVAFYMQELASSFHTFWSLGKNDPELMVLYAKNARIAVARLALLKAVGITLACGSKVLGVKLVNVLK